MKYEFHVGDYVENNYGKVGYINSVKYFYKREVGDYWLMGKRQIGRAPKEH